jgi:hypothetical protein
MYLADNVSTLFVGMLGHRAAIYDSYVGLGRGLDTQVSTTLKLTCNGR